MEQAIFPSICIVSGSLRRVGEHLVSSLNCLEFRVELELFARIAIWVVFES